MVGTQGIVAQLQPTLRQRARIKYKFCVHHDPVQANLLSVDYTGLMYRVCR
jgi:hypothetical protein